MMYNFSEEILEYGIKLKEGYSVKPISYQKDNAYNYIIFKDKVRKDIITSKNSPEILTDEERIKKFINKYTSNQEESKKVCKDLEEFLIYSWDKKMECESLEKKLMKKTVSSEERIKALEETVKKLEDDQKNFIEGMIFLQKKVNKLELLNRDDEK